MRSEIETAALLGLVREVLGTENEAVADAARELEELFECARRWLDGSGREVREALRIAMEVLSVVDRYEPMLVGLGGDAGTAAVRRERGRFGEILDDGRVRLAPEGGVVVFQTGSRRRTA